VWLKLTVILRQEFSTRTCAFNVATEDGSSNVRTAALDVLLRPKVACGRDVTRVAADVNETVTASSCTATGVTTK
jgi:hypothetical protein